jgi:hypothetical protein
MKEKTLTEMRHRLMTESLSSFGWTAWTLAGLAWNWIKINLLS